MSTPSPSDMHPSSGLIDPDRALHELALATTRVREAIPAAIPDGEPAAPVPTCPGWDAVALVEHLGGAHLWAAGAVRTGQRPGGMPTRDEDVRTLQQWYADAARELLDTLAEVPADTPAWTFAAGDRTAGFWRRRQLHETLVHAVDLALAGPRVDDLQPAEDTDEGPVRTGLVGEAHPVDRQRRFGVGDEHAVLLPLPEQSRGDGIPVLARLGRGDVDVDDVVRAAGTEGGDVRVGHDVVGRGDDRVVVGPGGIPQGGEGFESRHGPNPVRRRPPVWPSLTR